MISNFSIGKTIAYNYLFYLLLCKIIFIRKQYIEEVIYRVQREYNNFLYEKNSYGFDYTFFALYMRIPDLSIDESSSNKILFQLDTYKMNKGSFFHEYIHYLQTVSMYTGIELWYSFFTEIVVNLTKDNNIYNDDINILISNINSLSYIKAIKDFFKILTTDIKYLSSNEKVFDVIEEEVDMGNKNIPIVKIVLQNIDEKLYAYPVTFATVRESQAEAIQQIVNNDDWKGIKKIEIADLNEFDNHKYFLFVRMLNAKGYIGNSAQVIVVTELFMRDGWPKRNTVVLIMRILDIERTLFENVNIDCIDETLNQLAGKYKLFPNNTNVDSFVRKLNSNNSDNVLTCLMNEFQKYAVQFYSNGWKYVIELIKEAFINDVLDLNLQIFKIYGIPLLFTKTHNDTFCHLLNINTPKYIDYAEVFANMELLFFRLISNENIHQPCPFLSTQQCAKYYDECNKGFLNNIPFECKENMCHLLAGALNINLHTTKKVLWNPTNIRDSQIVDR